MLGYRSLFFSFSFSFTTFRKSHTRELDDLTCAIACIELHWKWKLDIMQHSPLTKLKFSLLKLCTSIKSSLLVELQN